MIPLGSNIQKGAIHFNRTYDRELQLQSLHEGNITQADLTPDELDAQVLQIDKEKQKQALQENTNLPDIPRLEKSTRISQKVKASTTIKTKHQDKSEPAL